MNESIFAQVFPFHRLAVDYVAAKLDVGKEAASGVVRSVLAGLFLEGGRTLGNPKRFLLRACRWKALKTLQRHAKRAPEVLIALEDEDRGKFFGTASEPVLEQREVFEFLFEGHSQAKVSAILESPESTVQMRIRLAKKRIGKGAA